jgi:amidase
MDATLEDLVSGLDSGQFSSVDLVSAYIARIDEVNSTLRMVTQINPNALSIAAELDAARAAGRKGGPLHGIPILLKDNTATADKLENTAGSYALLEARVPEDSTVAAKLRKAGAIILGKTNLSQWANFRSYNASNGWSSTGGQTEGPYYPEQDPSGSSSGSAVASTLGLALACLGTETDGSIISPSNYGNIVGIKPTVGLTSRYLVVPISEHQDTVGPMARSVKDAAYILSAIAGPDPKDNYTSAIPFKEVPDYVAACNPNALSGKRIGVPRDLIPSWPGYEPVISAFNAALDTLRAANATIIDPVPIPGWAAYSSAPYALTILQADFVSNLPAYLSHLTRNPHNITSLGDLLAFTHTHAALESYPEVDTALWEDALALGHGNADSPLFWSNYTAARRLAGPQGLTGALANHSLDALVMPTEWASSLPAVLGSPVVTVPLGKFPDDQPVVVNSRGMVQLAPGVPFGISFLGESWSEELLIGLAYAFEQLTKVRETVRPYVVPRTELKDVVGAKGRGCSKVGS